MNRHLLVSIIALGFFIGASLIRPILHRKRTGSWGFNGFSGTPLQAGWWGGAFFAAAVILFPLALFLDARTPLTSIAPMVTITGALFTLFAQSDMGVSWRIGVKGTEHTRLIRTGLFRFVRNPIFTGMIAFALGLAAWWPNWASLAALAALVLGIELQVRFVEEPYLRKLHGVQWLAWARRTGRFVPMVGTMR